MIVCFCGWFKVGCKSNLILNLSLSGRWINLWRQSTKLTQRGKRKKRFSLELFGLFLLENSEKRVKSSRLEVKSPSFCSSLLPGPSILKSIPFMMLPPKNIKVQLAVIMVVMILTSKFLILWKNPRSY